MYDARGHGLSDRAPADAYSFDTLADDLAGLVRELGLHQPIVLGHSLGSATAALAAARSPGLFGALLLEDPPGQLASPDGAADQATLERWRSDLIADQQLSAEQLIAKERARSPKWSDAELEPWADAKPRVDPNALCVITNPASEWHQLVEQIDCPLLLITGDPAAGAIVPPRRLPTSWPGAGSAGRWRISRARAIASGATSPSGICRRLASCSARSSDRLSKKTGPFTTKEQRDQGA